jgi:hypothetical protein
MKDVKARDRVKNEWVKDSQIAMVRFDYRTMDSIKAIPQIISDFLGKERSTTIEKHNLYYISEDSSVIADNGKY